MDGFEGLVKFAKQVRTPVSLAALVVLGLIFLYKQVLHLDRLGIDGLDHLIGYLFWLALAAIVFGIGAYTVVEVARTTGRPRWHGPPQDFIDILTEWIQVHRELGNAHTYFAASGLLHTWPGEHREMQNREDVLFSKVRLMLDSSKPQLARLLEQIETFRSDPFSPGEWLARREQLLRDVKAAYAAPPARV